MTDRLTVIFLAASACFTAVLPLEFRTDITRPDRPPQAIEKSDQLPSADNGGPELKQFVATTLARPLFSATRRPPENESGGHPDASLNDLRLTGIVITPDQRFAIFAKSDGKPIVRSEGEMISDWRIDAVAVQSIALSGPTGTTTLEPKADPNLARLQLANHPTVPAPQAPNGSRPSPAPNTPVRPAPVLRPER